MENEVSNIVTYMVTIIGIAAFLGVVSWSMFIGRDIENNVVHSVTNVQSELTTRFVDDLSSGDVDNEMPAASAFNILTMYEEVIAYSKCGICNEEVHLLTSSSCLGKHMTGKVQLEVLLKDGVFNVIIHKGDCNWKVGKCTCTNKSSLDAFRVKVTK